jgi:hypothetical protein
LLICFLFLPFFFCIFRVFFQFKKKYRWFGELNPNRKTCFVCTIFLATY